MAEFLQKMRAQALQAFDAAVAAADPAGAVTRALSGMTSEGAVGAGPVRLIAVGKAARPMAKAALEVLGAQVSVALVVTNAENAGGVSGARVLVAGHPVPDAAGEAAARAVEAMAADTGADETVLVLVSGGASAMLPAPVRGLTLADKIAASEAMLAGGLDITQMNAVRQHLSRLKGGGLARAAMPARVIGLILSDVIGDDLRVVASGPTVGRIATRAEARAILERAGVWSRMPQAVRAHLAQGDAPILPVVAQNHLIGSNAVSVRAAAATLPGAEIWSDALEGDVEDAAHWLAGRIRAAPPGPGAAVCGGETTVILRGTGRGGRNQELALRVAAALQGVMRPWVLLSGGTDGRDGPTNAAGAVVDTGTLDRIGAAGADWRALLANNDSYAALRAAGDLLITGGTGTNVADVQVIVLG